MNRNKHRDMTPYPLHEAPKKQHPLLLPLIWGGSLLLTLSNRVRITKKLDGLKPPYLVLAQHQGYTDYYLAPLALFPHRACYVSDMEGFANYGKNLYGRLGAIPTRRFVGDIRLVRQIRRALTELGQIVVLFPEARHSNVGRLSPLPPSTAKLIKHLGVPVVALTGHGSYLNSPIWDEGSRRRAPIEVRLEKILDPADIAGMNTDKLNAFIFERLDYDAYRWQWEEKISIPYPGRAEGLHKVLYGCPRCRTEYAMTSAGDSLACSRCGSVWRMDAHGRLTARDGETEFAHIPDWYDFLREQVREQIAAARYGLDRAVRIEALPGHKGFVPLGTGRLRHGAEGFTLDIPSTGQTLHFSSAGLFSVHTEYDYRGKGDSLVLSTRDCCYYLYAPEGDLGITKIQLAAERFHALKTGRPPTASNP